MNLITTSFSRSAGVPRLPRWRDADLASKRHPGNPAYAAGGSNRCTNDAPLEFRNKTSYRKRGSDCLLGDDDDEEDIGKFLLSYFEKGGGLLPSGGDDLKRLDDNEEGVSNGAFDDEHKSSRKTDMRQNDDEPATAPPPTTTTTIDPIPIGRTPELQLQIEAHAERVRRSIIQPVTKTSSQKKNANKRRKTFHSAGQVGVRGSDERLSLFSASCDLNGSDEANNAFMKASENTRKVFQIGVSNYNRDPTASQHDDDSTIDGSHHGNPFRLLDTSSSSFGNGASSCSPPLASGGNNEPPSLSIYPFKSGHRSTAATDNKRGSITELIAPMSALLSDMQRKSQSALTLNPGTMNRAIAVNKNDVVCGSGVLTDSMIGNRRYKVLIDLHSRSYAESGSEEERTEVARSVVNTIRSSVPPGRFIKLDVNSGLWREVDDYEDDDQGRSGGAVDYAERGLREAAGGGGAKLTPPTRAARPPAPDDAAMMDAHRRSSASSAIVLRCGHAMAA